MGRQSQKQTLRLSSGARRLLALAEAKVPVANRLGIVGIDYGPRIIGGRETDDRTVRIYVERKRIDGRAPAFSSRGKPVVPDVIAVRSRPRGALAKVGEFTGVHTGAAVLVQSGASFAFGGIGVLLTSGDDGPTHFVTAGHLFPRGAAGLPVLAAASSRAPPRPVGVLEVNLLDRPPPSIGFVLDVALVKLDALGRRLAFSVDGRCPYPSDVLDEDAIDTVPSHVYAPTLNDYSNPVDCSISHSFFFVQSPPFRPQKYKITNCIISEHPVTAPGDSGTVLVDAEEHRTALGICAGSDGRSSFFEPIARSLRALRDDHHLDLGPWSPP